jgi:squalene monooxygenase
MTETLDADIAIGGGGIVGSVAAVAISKLGFRVILIEPTLRSCRRRGGEMLHPRAIECLSRLGLLAGIREAGCARINGFHIRDGEYGDVVLSYAKAGLGPGIALDYERLHAILFAAAGSSPNVTVVHGKRVAALSDHGDHVKIQVTGKAGKATIRARLLVGADGGRSQIRELAGIDFGRRLVSMISALNIPAEALPDGEIGHVFVGAGGASLAYPIGEGRARLMVDHQSSAPRSIREVMALLSTACPDRFRKLLGDLPEDQRVHHFPVDIAIVDKPYRGRVVLIGDAAGTCHPLTASGMTSGIADAVNLAEALSDSQDGIAQTFARHAAKCRPRQASRIALASAMHEVLAGATPEFALLRLAMMRYWRSITGGPRAIALLSMAEDRPVKLRQAMASTLRYGLGELLSPSTPTKLMDRWRIGLGVSRIMLRYRAGSGVRSGDFSMSRGEASL